MVEGNQGYLRYAKRLDGTLSRITGIESKLMQTLRYPRNDSVTSSKPPSTWSSTRSFLSHQKFDGSLPMRRRLLARDKRFSAKSLSSSHARLWYLSFLPAPECSSGWEFTLPVTLITRNFRLLAKTLLGCSSRSFGSNWRKTT